MTWTNAFDAGTCTVKVSRASDGDVDFDAAMVKGQTENVPDGSYAGLTVSVSASGVVALNNTLGGGIEDTFEVAVFPAGIAGFDGARATLPTCGSGSGEASGNGISYSDFANGDASVVVSANTPLDRITVRPTYQGSSAVSPLVQFTPELETLDLVVAPDESLVVAQNSADNAVAPVITFNGTPAAADSLAIDSDPLHGAASVSGTSLLYTPDTGYFGPDSFDYTATIGGTQSNVATVSITMLQTHNCDCDDTTNNKTLKQLRDDLMRRLGFGAQVNNPPPGMADLLNSFLIEAQELLYRRYAVLRTERFYSWTLQAGVRMYDIDANDETCTKRLDPRKVTWVGVVRDEIWYPLVCGIPPELYSHAQQGWPQRYEIRQCIEVWPVPQDTEGSLVVKGHFGLEAFAADTDKTTIDDRLVFMLALSNAKAHYRQPDAGNYVREFEAMMQNLVAGSHQTRRYIPGRRNRADGVYVIPKPTVPFDGT